MNDRKVKFTAVVLAAGFGRRMNSPVQKQFMVLNGKPLIYYTLDAFEKSPVDEIILVVGLDEISYCKENIVNKYGFTKVKSIVSGGKERYHSVYNGLIEAAEAGYVLIHDGARPFVSEEIIRSNMDAVLENKACVTAVPVKDTIKISDGEGYVKETPERSLVWQVQTPQTFEYNLVRQAYDCLMEAGSISVTDDAMVVETFLGKRIKLVEGSYKNIKITTPEDLLIAQVFVGGDE